jgi:predicted DCC family thiol-disulfide oxidoreductase YuxK
VPGSKPILLYDARCGFCKIWIDYWKQLTGDRIEYATSQEAGAEHPQIPPQVFAEAVVLARPDGTWVRGARAVFESLGREKSYEKSRVWAALSEFAYRIIARNRGFFYQLTKYTFGTRIEPTRFEATQWLFLRALAVIYAIAFASLGVQITGLIGERGVLPLAGYMEQVEKALGAARFHAMPAIFWWTGASDRALTAVCWGGVAFAVLLFFGRLERLCLIVLFVLYLSLSVSGQDFLSFQWDALLIETGFLAIFLGRLPVFAWLFRWLVFRFFLMSGCVKLLSGDPTWHNLTALEYHYHTQPLPTVLAWYADKLPGWFQHFSTFMTLAIEIGTPFLIFLPRRLRHFGAACMIGLQVLILLTGNYTFFNLLTIALCLFLFDDQALRRFAPRRDHPSPPGRVQKTLAAVLAAYIFLLGATRLIEMFSGGAPEPLRSISRLSAPFEIVNSYGLFAVMTTTRPEIIVEGSEDGDNWVAYEFRYKPGALNRAPRWAAPYQPRLDWQMWFAALGNYRQNLWFVGMAAKLLEGSPEVAALLEKNPFPGKPPRYIRAQVYEYTFTDAAAKSKTGAWWQKKLLGAYLPPVGMRQRAE